MTRQTAIRLPEETFVRLQQLAAKTGRTASFYIRQAIDEHLDDMEDIYFSDRAIEEVRKGKDSIISSEEFWNGLDD